MAASPGRDSLVIGTMLASLGVLFGMSTTGNDLSIFADAFTRVIGFALFVPGLALVFFGISSQRNPRGASSFDPNGSPYSNSEPIAGKRLSQLLLRIRLAVAASFIWGSLKLALAIVGANILMSDPDRPLNVESLSRDWPPLASAILTLTCATFLWRDYSLVAAYVLASAGILGTIFSRSPMVNAFLATICISAILAIREIRGAVPENSAA